MTSSVPPDVAEAYFSWHERGEFRLQRCRNCARWQHPPLATCPACGSQDFVWEPTSGRGTVFSWTVTRYPLVPAFTDLLPYVNAVVETEEGPRVFALLVGIPPKDVTLGQPVAVRFAEVDGRDLAVFAPSG
jgi:uncharacterized OB-fold protein